VPFVSINEQIQISRQFAGLQKQRVQLIPPEFAAFAGVPGRYEHRGRDVMFLKERLRIKQIIGVTVIERYRDASAGKHSVLNGGGQFSERCQAAVFTQHLKMLLQMPGTNRQLPWIRFGFRDPVVQQYQRSRSKISSDFFDASIEFFRGRV
jgi:hypothetical protein